MPSPRAETRLPSGVNGQVLALLLALVTVGVFAGASVFHQTTYGDRWRHDAVECTLRYAWQPDAAGNVDLAVQQLWQACMNRATRWLVTFELGFVALAVLATVAAALLGPSWPRWRRRWRPWPAALTRTQQRVAILAAEAGHRRVPRLFLGSNSLRDALSSGVPGRYAIVLPKKLAVDPDSELFAATVRHELAHVRRHDVLVAWSTRPAIRVAAALLLVPVVGAMVDRDWSLLPGYLWRAAVLLATTVAICAVILRARELEADALSAVRPGDREELLHALTQARPRPRRGWHRLGAFHPVPEERSRALLDPARAARLRFSDTLGVSFLVALALPLLNGLAADRPAWTAIGTTLTSFLGGLVLALSVGDALWRSAYVSAGCGRPFRPLPALLGVLAGFVAGSVVSLQVGNVVEAFRVDPLALLTPVLVAGATAMAAAVAASSASWGVTRPSPAPRALLRVSLSALPVVCALQISATLITAYEGGGWAYLSLGLLAISHASVTVFVVALVGCAWLLVLRRAGRRVVATTIAVAVVCGLLAVAVLVGYRLRNGPPLDDAAFGRAILYLQVLAVGGLVAALALVARFGRPGWGLGLVAGSAAAGIGGLLFPIANAVLLDAPDALAAGVGFLVLTQSQVFLLLALSTLVGSILLGLRDRIGPRRSGGVSADRRT